MSMLTLATISAVLVALSSAYPQFSPQFTQQPFSQFGQFRKPQVEVISRVDQRDDSGQFNFRYQTGDGQTFQETGVPKRNFQNDGDVITKTGSYSYISPEGIPIQLDYIADEFGFRPVGNHLPKPVQPIPARF